jgi:hypothetical protein
METCSTRTTTRESIFILMPNRPLTAKESSAIEFYCNIDSDTFNKWGESYLKANYSKCKGWERNAYLVRHKDVVEAGIEAYKGRTGARTARTVESIDDMYQAAYALAEATKQSSSMVSAATGIARLYGMDKDTQSNPDQPLPLTKEELDQANRAANVVLASQEAV